LHWSWIGYWRRLSCIVWRFNALTFNGSRNSWIQYLFHNWFLVALKRNHRFVRAFDGVVTLGMMRVIDEVVLMYFCPTGRGMVIGLLRKSRTVVRMPRNTEWRNSHWPPSRSQSPQIKSLSKRPFQWEYSPLFATTQASRSIHDLKTFWKSRKWHGVTWRDVTWLYASWITLRISSGPCKRRSLIILLIVPNAQKSYGLRSGE
jgi:hypothetical protein